MRLITLCIQAVLAKTSPLLPLPRPRSDRIVLGQVYRGGVRKMFASLLSLPNFEKNLTGVELKVGDSQVSGGGVCRCVY